MKATATESSTWSVSVWRPNLRADSCVQSVRMVSAPSCGVIVDVRVKCCCFFTDFNPAPSTLSPPGNHLCFSCKTAGQEVMRCSVAGCGCYYHEDCVRKLPGTTSSQAGSFSCPQHICSTCCLERDLQRTSKGNTAGLRTKAASAECEEVCFQDILGSLMMLLNTGNSNECMGQGRTFRIV